MSSIRSYTNPARKKNTDYLIEENLQKGQDRSEVCGKRINYTKGSYS